jgi:hypothetical protein
MKKVKIYEEEARQKWGHTEAWKQSQEKVKKMGKAGLKKVLAESEKLTEEIAECMKNGEDPTGDVAQKLIAKHYEGLRAFYEPNLEMYRGLAEMCVADPRFAANYEKVAKGLVTFMHAAMLHFADEQQKKK